MAIGWRGQYYRYKDFYLNILNLYKRRADLRAFLEVVLSIGTITIFLLFALKPTAITIIDLVKVINEKRTTLLALNQKVTDLDSASGVFSQNKNIIPDVDAAVPTSPSPDVLAKQIAALSAKNSVEVLGLSVGQVTLIGTPPVKKASSEFKPLPGGAKEMQFSVNVKGAFQNLESFVKDFENLRLISKIDTLSFSSSTTETGRVIVAVISGRIPFLGK